MQTLKNVELIFDNNIYTEVETAILGNNKFNIEQKKFINFLTTAVFEAGPGSGKTTVLSAKIALLLKKIEKEGNLDGICVITHTNAAVSEILTNLSKIGFNKITHPHFIGTINEFFNKYGMFPYLQKTAPENWEIIDEDILKQMLKIDLSNKPEHNWMTKEDWRDRALGTCYKLLDSHLSFDSQNELEANVYNNNFPKFGNYKENYLTLKQKYWQEGIFHMNDTFCLAQRFFKYSGTIQRLQNRFKYIFMDEYQDISPLAFELLRKLFLTPNNIFQVIGDRNQHISYSNPEVDISYFPIYYLNQINRFGDTVVNPLNKMFPSNNLNSLIPDKSLKPILLIYENEKEIPVKFGEVLKENNLSENYEHNILVFVKAHTNDLSIPLLKTHRNLNGSIFHQAKKLIYKRLSKVLQIRFGILKSVLQKQIPELDFMINTCLLSYFKKIPNSQEQLLQAINNILVFHKEKELLSIDDKLFFKLNMLNQTQPSNIDTPLPLINAKTVHDLKGQTLTSSLVYLKKDSKEEKAFLDTYSTEIQLDESELINKRVLYVAMSRATTLLIIACHTDSYSTLSAKERTILENDFNILTSVVVH